MNTKMMKAAQDKAAHAEEIHARLRGATTDAERAKIQDEYETAFHAAGDAIRKAAAAEEDG